MSEHKVNFFGSKPQLPEENTDQHPNKIQGNLSCRNYGFECNFFASGNEIEKIVEEFREHIKNEHNTDYPAGILKKSLL